MVRLLTRDADVSTISSEVVLCTCYTRNESVTWAVLDALRCEKTSKDSLGNCDFLFHHLDILDNPNAVMTWPDGSTTDLGETAVKILTDQGRIDVLVHPAMRGLLHWKFESFGKTLMVAEFAIYISWLIDEQNPRLKVPCARLPTTVRSNGFSSSGGVWLVALGGMRGSYLSLGAVATCPFERWKLCCANVAGG